MIKNKYYWLFSYFLLTIEAKMFYKISVNRSLVVKDTYPDVNNVEEAMRFFEGMLSSMLHFTFLHFSQHIGLINQSIY